MGERHTQGEACERKTSAKTGACAIYATTEHVMWAWSSATKRISNGRRPKPFDEHIRDLSNCQRYSNNIFFFYFYLAFVIIAFSSIHNRTLCLA